MDPTERLILIVDHDADGRQATLLSLKRAGYLVVTAPDCATARQTLELTRADLLIVRASVPFDDLAELIMVARPALVHARILVLAHEKEMGMAAEIARRLRAFAPSVGLIPAGAGASLPHLVRRALYGRVGKMPGAMDVLSLVA